MLSNKADGRHETAGALTDLLDPLHTKESLFIKGLKETSAWAAFALLGSKLEDQEELWSDFGQCPCHEG